MKQQTLLKWLWFFLGVAFAIWIVSSPLWAGDDCRGNSCNGGGGTDVDVNTDVTVGGDTVNVPVNVTGGAQSVTGSNYSNSSKALALSNSLGDVDIAGCLGSTQWATPLFSKQKLSVNWACLAEFYLRTGKYEMAAMAMCNTEIRNEFTSEDDCRSAHNFEPQVAQVAPGIDDRDEDDDRYRAEQQMAYDGLQMQIQELRAQKAPRPTTVVQKTEFISADKRAKLEALRGEK